MISRYNITMDTRLHDAGMAHAKDAHYTDFSGLLSILLRAELSQYGSPSGGHKSESVTDTFSSLKNKLPHTPKDANSQRKKRIKK